ncbi:MAG: hypothetical protein H7A09_10820 [Oceanospirillaceae bacterium]|nr:hypothetical protein [Oceanospirillaceae bacterium]MCP5349690.1 hypothetical protein [Oceanospirillaceae bacterium]
MRYLFLVLLFGLISACQLPDTKKSGTSSGDSVSLLSGLYSGTTDFYPTSGAATEGITTLLLFVGDTAYLLRTDEAYVGTYSQDGLGGITLTMTPYTYSETDTDNNVYIGAAAANASAQEITAVLASNNTLVASYTATAGSGYITLTLDTDRASSVSLSVIEGSWKTTDQVQTINAQGRFLNYNTLNSCQTDGQLSVNGDLFNLSMNRINCTAFTGASEGLGFLMGTGELNYVARSSNKLLWMQFAPDVLTNTTP